MESIGHYIKNRLQIDLPEWRKVSVEDTRTLWHQAAKTILPSWQDLNHEVTEQLILFIARSKDFKGDLNKGILFVGGIGTGKTKYLQILSSMVGYIHRYKAKIYSGLQMEGCFRMKETAKERKDLETVLKHRMFAFDDIGEEHEKVKVYGTDINVGIEVLTIRYNEMQSRGSLTFATTNLNMKMIADRYGSRIESRCFEMFNIITVTGNDLRKTP